MQSREVTIINKQGLHARPATALVNTASKFKSKIFISRGEKKVNGKSILGLLVLAAEHGAKLLVSAEGPDENDALSAIEELVQNRFGMSEKD